MVARRDAAGDFDVDELVVGRLGGDEFIVMLQDLSGDGRKGLGLFALAGYKRLLGQYADSPIVRDAGSANQGFAVAGLTYSF